MEEKIAISRSEYERLIMLEHDIELLKQLFGNEHFYFSSCDKEKVVKLILKIEE